MVISYGVSGFTGAVRYKLLSSTKPVALRSSSQRFPIQTATTVKNFNFLHGFILTCTGNRHHGKLTSPALLTRTFSTYEGRAIADEELIQEKDDWAIEETNFCLGRFPAHTYFPETSDMARRTIQLMETQKSRMFTRLRDGTVIPVMSQMVHYVYDSPDTLFNYFERPIVKYTWDETYDDAWEEEEPEFEDGEATTPPSTYTPSEPEPPDPAFTEWELIKRTTGGV